MVSRRNRERLTQAQIVKLINVKLLLGRIGLVYSQHNRLAAFAQNPGNVGVLLHNAAARIAHKQNNICLFNGNFRLLADGNSNRVAVHNLNTAGINHHKLVVQPVALGVKAVARYARGVFNNGNAAVCKNIKQCRFADIRPANNGNYRFTHSTNLTL